MTTNSDSFFKIKFYIHNDRNSTASLYGKLHSIFLYCLGKTLKFVLKKLYFRKECFRNSDSITKTKGAFKVIIDNIKKVRSNYVYTIISNSRSVDLIVKFTITTSLLCIMKEHQVEAFSKKWKMAVTIFLPSILSDNLN